ncbi:girdin-like [Dunckerocampus dactyliophorus]|uniref:girdin-like n=1 Tax=Dunckerocampus dactyliophorus TaxID=161453 RepID=UPI002405251A|nr:girdin-like [Dunckerocampus dactyliophorus]
MARLGEMRLNSKMAQKNRIMEKTEQREEKQKNAETKTKTEILKRDTPTICHEMKDTERLRKTTQGGKHEIEFLRTKIWKQYWDIERLKAEKDDQKLWIRTLTLQMQYFAEKVGVSVKTAIQEKMLLQKTLAEINKKTQILEKQYNGIKTKQHKLESIVTHFRQRSQKHTKKQTTTFPGIKQSAILDTAEFLQSCVLKNRGQKLKKIMQHVVNKGKPIEEESLMMHPNKKVTAKMYRLLLKVKAIKWTHMKRARNAKDFAEEQRKFKRMKYRAQKKCQDLDQRRERIMKERDELEILRLKIHQQRDQLEDKGLTETIQTMAKVNATHRCKAEHHLHEDVQLNKMTRWTSDEMMTQNISGKCIDSSIKNPFSAITCELKEGLNETNMDSFNNITLEQDSAPLNWTEMDEEIDVDGDLIRERRHIKNEIRKLTEEGKKVRQTIKNSMWEMEKTNCDINKLIMEINHLQSQRQKTESNLQIILNAAETPRDRKNDAQKQDHNENKDEHIPEFQIKMTTQDLKSQSYFLQKRDESKQLRESFSDKEEQVRKDTQSVVAAQNVDISNNSKEDIQRQKNKLDDKKPVIEQDLHKIELEPDIKKKLSEQASRKSLRQKETEKLWNQVKTERRFIDMAAKKKKRELDKRLEKIRRERDELELLNSKLQEQQNEQSHHASNDQTCRHSNRRMQHLERMKVENILVKTNEEHISSKVNGHFTGLHELRKVIHTQLERGRKEMEILENAKDHLWKQKLSLVTLNAKNKTNNEGLQKRLLALKHRLADHRQVKNQISITNKLIWNVKIRMDNLLSNIVKEKEDIGNQKVKLLVEKPNLNKLKNKFKQEKEYLIQSNEIMSKEKLEPDMKKEKITLEENQHQITDRYSDLEITGNEFRKKKKEIDTLVEEMKKERNTIHNLNAGFQIKIADLNYDRCLLKQQKEDLDVIREEHDKKRKEFESATKKMSTEMQKILLERRLHAKDREKMESEQKVWEDDFRTNIQSIQRITENLKAQKKKKLENISKKMVTLETNNEGVQKMLLELKHMLADHTQVRNQISINNKLIRNGKTQVDNLLSKFVKEKEDIENQKVKLSVEKQDLDKLKNEIKHEKEYLIQANEIMTKEKLEMDLMKSDMKKEMITLEDNTRKIKDRYIDLEITANMLRKTKVEMDTLVEDMKKTKDEVNFDRCLSKQQNDNFEVIRQEHDKKRKELESAMKTMTTVMEKLLTMKANFDIERRLHAREREKIEHLQFEQKVREDHINTKILALQGITDHLKAQNKKKLQDINTKVVHLETNNEGVQKMLLELKTMLADHTQVRNQISIKNKLWNAKIQLDNLLSNIVKEKEDIENQNAKILVEKQDLDKLKNEIKQEKEYLTQANEIMTKEKLEMDLMKSDMKKEMITLEDNTRKIKDRYIDLEITANMLRKTKTILK